ncbi:MULTISPECIES: ATP-binding protein [unclassified Nostoc]|uniref:ATP-binding protein n=1 Tax=unclassified Nostoc TaxID=2593658 RepID=UPI002AD47DB6|nr:ATP-binding protein [Nostoc sp. DedQUE03]MDZ7974105.1 ATP-binding protein [Nostoc sp. DedQUE03]MDZ8048107.1 ATP-binding protein [Nostoc sp. DedQUE02]
MKLPSFRLRLALLSAALAGSTLVGFGAVSWFQIYNAKISRLDAELLNHLMRATPNFVPREEPPVGAASPRRELSKENSGDRGRSQFYEDSLSYSFGTNTKIPVALLVLDANNNIVYKSNSLPADLELNRLLLKRLELTPLPPPPKREPPPLPSNANPSLERPPLIRPRPPQFVTEQTATAVWRIGAAKFPNAQIAIAVSLQAVDQEMATIRNIFLVSIPGALLLVAVGAWLVSGGALRPIRQLTGVIQQVTVKGLDQRIPIGTTDVEFVELIQVFNLMLSRLERSFTQASRFSGDAAHELKTPLTILQGELERTLQQVDPGSEVQQRLSNLLDEVRRLSGIMRKLLLLSLADAGKMSLYLVEVDMSELLMEMLEDVEMLAPHLTVQTDFIDGLRVKGDRDLLIQVLQNLFSNAIKYNLPNGWIRIRTHQTPTTLQITIVNASKDIPLSERNRIFDRFYRGDPSRNRKIEGIGLGLSLAREIARAHRGDLTLDLTSAGQTAFTLTLPIKLQN